MGTLSPVDHWFESGACQTRLPSNDLSKRLAESQSSFQRTDIGSTEIPSLPLQTASAERPQQPMEPELVIPLGEGPGDNGRESL